MIESGTVDLDDYTRLADDGCPNCGHHLGDPPSPVACDPISLLADTVDRMAARAMRTRLDVWRALRLPIGFGGFGQ